MKFLSKELPQLQKHKTGFIYPTILLLIAIFPIKFLKQSYSKGENPGYFEQWLREKQNAQGKIPASMVHLWAAWDKSHGLLSNRADNPIDSVIALGPNKTGGRTRALWWNPSNANILLAGGISGGLWRSTNKGASWTAINDQETSLMPSCIASNPKNQNTIIYGTGESRANSADVDGNGIYRSYDGGLSFHALPNTVGKSTFSSIWDIKYSLDDSNIIYVATNSNGLIRTTDGGETWEVALSGAGAGQVNHLVVMPGGKVLCSTYAGSIYYSSQSGEPGSFTITTQPSKPSSGVYGRIQIAGCKNYPNVVYALFSHNTFSSGPLAFYKSSDYGVTWVSKSNPSAINASYTNYCLMLGVSDADSNKVVAGAVNIAESINGGSSWTAKNVGHSDHHSFYQNPANTGEYIVGNDGGIWLYKWGINSLPSDLNTGYVTTQFYAGGFGPQGMAAASGAQDNGTHVAYNKLSTNKLYGADGAYAHIGLQTGMVAYFSTQNEGIRRSDNFSYTSSTFSSVGISDPQFTNDGVDFINSYRINPADEEQLYYRTNFGLYRSTNSGNSWTQIIKRGGIKAIAVESTADPVVYVGGSSSCLYRLKSSATATTFGSEKIFTSTAPISVSGDFINCIDIVPNDNNTILVAYSNNSNNARIWKVTGFEQNAVKWKSVSGDLPKGLPVNFVCQDPSSPLKNLFAATDYGLYYSVDSGVTWKKETRIPNVAVHEVKIRNDRKVFVFTHGRGMFYLTLTAASQGNAMQNNPSQNSASNLQLYPNPCNNYMNILGINAEQLDATIFDLKGTKIWSNKNMPSTSPINVSMLAPGTYWIQIKVQNQAILTRRFNKL